MLKKEDKCLRETLINATIEALSLVTNPRFFNTERGYQGVFFCELQRILKAEGIVDGNCILEMEYQKSSRHGIGQRPDIILHIPVEISREDVTQNNFAVWALKLRGKDNDAKEDFEKLDEMFDSLHYPLGFFINIASESHYLSEYEGNFREKIVAIAVNLIMEETIVIKRAFWHNGSINEITFRKPLS